MIYILLIEYIKSLLWRVAKRLSYIEDAWCLKVKVSGLLLAYNQLNSDQNGMVSTADNTKNTQNACGHISYGEVCSLILNGLIPENYAETCPEQD